MTAIISGDAKSDALIKKMVGLGILEFRNDRFAMTDRFSSDLANTIVFSKIPSELAALVTLVDFYTKAYPESDITPMYAVLLKGWIADMPDHMKAKYSG